MFSTVSIWKGASPLSRPSLEQHVNLDILNNMSSDNVDAWNNMSTKTNVKRQLTPSRKEPRSSILIPDNYAVQLEH